MNEIREYLISILCITVLCGLLQTFSPKGAAGSAMRYVAGIIITITVLTPLMQDKAFQWNVDFEDFLTQSEQAVSKGQAVASSAYIEHIQQSLSAYILDEAEEMDVKIQVETDIQKEYPYEIQVVRIKGTVAPYIKKALTASLERNLGISEEMILWNS